MACLDSVKDFVDEIVVLDTGSSDGTVAIAEAAGARVEKLPWPGDFAPARNAALKFVNGDWVLVLDADEQLLPRCIPELKSYMLMQDILLVNLLRYEQGSTMTPYSNVSRLFRRHPSVKWDRPYHSIVDDSVNQILKEEPYWRVVNCKEPALIHYGYQPDIIANRNKANRLREAMEDWLADNPDDPYASAKLGALEVSEGAIDKGLNLLKKGLVKVGKRRENSVQRYELLLNLGIALSGIDTSAAIAAYREAISLEMDDRIQIGAELNLAALLMNQGDVDEAIVLTSHVTIRAPEIALAWYNLGLMHRMKGSLDQAIKAYSRAISIDPSHPETLQNLALAKLLNGDIVSAREYFQRALLMYKQQSRTTEGNILSEKIRGILKLDWDD